MKTKEMLYEWKSFLQKDIINEISIKRFQEQHPNFDTSGFSNQIKGNTDYLDIINNSIVANQNHGPNDFIQQFDFYKNSIEPNRNNQDFLTIDIPGEIEPVSLAGKVNQGSCTATYDDIQQFQQARMFTLGKGSKNKLIAAYEKVLDEASQDDFETVVENSDWIIFYPKSTKGSIALARSYWDGNKIAYDKTFNPSKGYGQNSGIIKWCTSVTGAGNMFLSYHRQFNLHMYYCIKKHLNSVKEVDRKICISLSKNNKKIAFVGNHASVNADNSQIKEVTAQKYIGDLYDSLIEDVKQEKRSEIDPVSYYQSIGISQYIIMREANEDNIDDFLPELRSIIEHSKDSEKIINHCIQDRNTSIRECLTKYYFYLSEQQFEMLINDEDDVVKEGAIGSLYDFYSLVIKKDVPKELALKIIKSPSEDLRFKFAVCMRNPSDEVLEMLLNDESLKVVKAVASNSYTKNEVLIDIVNKYPENDEILNLVLNNNNLKHETIRMFFDSDALTINQKLILAYRGSMQHTPAEGDPYTILSKKELLDIYDEAKKSGLINLDTLKYFSMSEVEEIYLDTVDFCTENKKGNRNKIKNLLLGILANRVGVTERVITKILNMTDDIAIIKTIAGHYNTPSSILREILLNVGHKKNAGSIKAFIAMNPNTPIDVLESLSNDNIKKVSKLAIDNLNQKTKNESNLKIKPQLQNKLIKDYIKLFLS